MTGAAPCPDRETLAALLRGALSPEREDHVTQHLESCLNCEARVQQLETQPDPVVEALRQSLLRTDRMAPASSTPASPVPLQLDGFEILGEIGRGGMGIVYRARQHRLGRIVAIKMIVSGQLADAEERVRFLLEGALLARLNHPNFVQVYEVGTVQTAAGAMQPYLVLEHVDGGTLKERLTAGPLDAAHAARLVLDLARAMAVAHAQGIVHRDLKPANVLIAHDGTLKISDFGLAKELSGDSSLTPTGATVGTPAYMAPEQARGNRGIGPAADIYALGVILYEMLAGRPPFGGDTPMTILLQVLDQAPASLTNLCRVPRDLETICLKCLEKEPPRRYATATALADDLDAWLGGRPIHARPAGRIERLYKWTRRHPLSAALVVLLVLSLVGGSAASTFFGITAQRRAEETEQALGREAKARLASDRRAAELELVAGQRLAADGEVDRGLFTLVRGWRLTPEEDTELRRVFQRNLEAWALYLPRLRWQAETPFTASALYDGQVVIAGSSKNVVRVLDAESGRPLGPPRAYEGESVAGFSPDGRLVYTNTLRDQVATLRVFERDSGKQIAVIVDERGGDLWRGASNRIYRTRIVADNRYLLREYLSADTQERQIWDLATGRAVGAAAVGGAAHVEVVADAAGGVFWLFFEGSGQAVVKDAQTGMVLPGTAAALSRAARTAPELFPHPDIVQAHLYDQTTWWDVVQDAALHVPWRPAIGKYHGSTDGRHVVTVRGDQRLGWHELATRQPLAPTAAVGPGGSVYSVDGPTCLYVQAHRRVKLVDFPRLWPAHAVGDSDSSLFRGVAPVAIRFRRADFSPEQTAVLFSECQSASPNYYARLSSTANQRAVGRPITDCDAHGAFSSTGKLVALATRDGDQATAVKVRVYDAPSGAPHGPALELKYYVNTLVFSPDDRRLLIGAVDAGNVLDLATGAAKKLAQPGPIARVLWSPDGTRVALAGCSGWERSRAGVQVWDAVEGKPLGDLVRMGDVPVLIGAAGTTFHTLELDTGRLRRWDFAAGGAVADLGTLSDWPGPPGDNRAEHWAVRGDGQHFAHGARQGLIRQWDLTTGRRLPPIADFHQPCDRLQYSRDGRWLAVSGDDGDVALFDPLTGTQAGPLLIHRAPVRSLAFTPDSAELLTATEDGRCMHWPLAAEQSLTPAQWQIWLEAATGMHLDGPLLVPLPVADHQQRVAVASKLGLPLRLPPAPAWHAEQARAAEQAGQLNAARRHLDRWIAAEPTAWLPRARRARIHARIGNTKQAETDLRKAAQLGRGTELEDWKLHEAAIARITGRPLKLE